MKLLVFEFATATGLEDESITAEGLAMLEAALDDLKEYKPHYLIPDKDKPVNCDAYPVSTGGNIHAWLNNHVMDYDACLPIVPEEDYLLYELTRIIERHGVKVLGSDSDAVKLTTNKFDMYKVLDGKVPVVKTQKVYFDDDLEEDFRSMFHHGISRVVKPADGVSCTGVMIVNSMEEFLYAVKIIKQFTKLPYFIMQDYIAGESVSVSLISTGETAVPLSLNLQKLEIKDGKFTYQGGKVPLDHELSELAKQTAKDAVELVGGITGFAGVDLILNQDGVHLVEINSRLTTPYVALRRIINFNIGMAMINAVNKELPKNIRLNGEVNYYKEGKSLRVSVLNENSRI